MTEPRDAAVGAFVETSADYWVRGGLSRAAGLILGHLMTVEPAERSQAEIAAALGLSAGTVSTQLASLTRVGLVEAVARLGTRARMYRLPEHMWVRIMASENERIAGLRALADAALAVAPQTRRDRVTSLDAMVRFWEAEWPALEQRFDDFIRKEGQ